MTRAAGCARWRASLAPWLGFGISLALLGALVAYTVRHLGDARRFAALLEHTEPRWLAVGLALQLGTYGCAGGIWYRVAAAAGHGLDLVAAARLSVEKLGINQLVPTGGLAGDVVVAGALRRLGLPLAVAMEAVLIDVVTYFVAYAAAVLLALGILSTRRDVTPAVLASFGGCAAMLGLVPVAIWWLLRHRDWRPPAWIARWRVVGRLRSLLRGFGTSRVRSPRLLLAAATLQGGIVLLDAATLWAMLQAIGSPAPASVCFVALVTAQIARTLSVLPAGIGPFEAGSLASLALLGVPIEAALAATLLFRGFALWLPLVPGVLLARRDLTLWHRGRSVKR